MFPASCDLVVAIEFKLTTIAPLLMELRAKSFTSILSLLFYVARHVCPAFSLRAVGHICLQVLAEDSCILQRFEPPQNGVRARPVQTLESALFWRMGLGGTTHSAFASPSPPQTALQLDRSSKHKVTIVVSRSISLANHVALAPFSVQLLALATIVLIMELCCPSHGRQVLTWSS